MMQEFRENRPQEENRQELSAQPFTLTLWSQLITSADKVSSRTLECWSEKLQQQQVDVVCLMEVYQDSRVSFFEGLSHKLVKAANLGASYFQLVSEPTTHGYGNLIISRWPIEQPTYLPLVNFANKEEWGALVATLRTPAGPVCCLVSSLAWGFRKQFYQLRQLLSHPYLKHFNNHQIPVIWVGGFRDSLNLQSTGLMYRQQWKSSQAKQGQILTWPAMMPVWGPDKVYYKGPVREVGTRSTRFTFNPAISAHLPIISEFALLEKE